MASLYVNVSSIHCVKKLHYSNQFITRADDEVRVLRSLCHDVCVCGYVC